MYLVLSLRPGATLVPLAAMENSAQVWSTQFMHAMPKLAPSHHLCARVRVVANGRSYHLNPLELVHMRS